MLAGLVGTGPTLKVPVPDSKDRKAESQQNQLGEKFGDVLDKQSAPTKLETPERVQVSKGEKPERESIREDKEVKSEGPPDPKKVMDPRTSAAQAQRTQAIRKFMDSFESEFGIPPQEVVEAMAQLTTQDLEKPPEQTADNLIAELNLAPQDEMKAKKMYMGLLVQLKQIDVRAEMVRPQDDLLAQMSAQRIQLSGDKKEVLKTQVKGLNDQFFMKNTEAAAELPLPQSVDQAKVQEFLKKVVTAEDFNAEAFHADPEATIENLLKKLEADIPEMANESEAPKQIAFMPMKTQMQSEQQQDDQQPQAEMADQPELTELPKNIEASAVVTEFKKQIEKSSSSEPEKKKISKESVEMLLSGDLSSMKPAQLESLMRALPVQDKPLVADMSPTQKTENIQQLMNQAQVLMKKGGGEVKVEMTPEGLGTIQMKMQVENGKVQLHMNTETPEAKKMIESSMHDLKHSLAAHQLSVDLVKVDVVTQANSAQNAQNEMQNQMQNFMNQQQREGTRQFWQQFNENFGNRQARENYFDAQNIKSPTRHQSLPGIEGVSSAGRARSDGRGKSINLVA